MSRVVVVGGGLAGLTATYELAKLGLQPLLLERGGHLGGKLMSAVGYGGMPIEHGVHGWWKGYGNFFDVLRQLHGDDFEAKLFSGPYYSRFIVKPPVGAVVRANRAPPLQGEPRVAPFALAMRDMVAQGLLSWTDLASVLRFVARAIGFDHKRDYDEWKRVTAGGVADECGVSKRAQQYVLANFSLASAFAPLDRLSAAAFFSSLGFYVFDSEAALAAHWLRTHPDVVIHRPLCAAIEAAGGAVSPYSRVLGIARSKERGPVDTVFVDRAHTGTLDVRDLTSEPRDLLHDSFAHTPPAQLALARATLRRHAHVWLALERAGDDPDAAVVPIAWTGDRARRDDGRLEVEWCDEAMSRVRVLEDRYETLGRIAAADVREGSFREMLWAGRAGLTTSEKDLSELREALRERAYLFTMHTCDLATPPHLPLYVGRMRGEARGYAGICTHFGGRLRWEPSFNGFGCQLHGSRFGCDGQRTCGPAEADLFPFRLVPSGDFLEVQVRQPAEIRAESVVLATDVSGLRHIIQSSPTLHATPAAAGLLRLRTTSVTVVRFVLGRRIDDTLAIFDGFPAMDALFNVTKLQGLQLDQYKDRVHEVIELQIYDERFAGQLSREALVATIRENLKEAFGWDDLPDVLDPIHVAVHRDVYSSYDPESEEFRPGTTAKDLDGLVFAGDWVQPDDAAWYMERAVRTGRLAARAVARRAGIDEERVPLVPRVRDRWALRDLLSEGEGGLDKALSLLHRLFGYHDGIGNDGA